MCDFSKKLVAWIDGELTDNEAADVERHLKSCSECQSAIAAYKNVSRLVVTYCDAKVAETRRRRKMPRWVPVLSGAAAAALILLAIALLVPRRPPQVMFRASSVKQVAVTVQVADVSPALIRETAPTPLKVRKVHQGQRIRAGNASRANWAFAEPAIKIAIPADAMFPPGAVPEGITFIADLSMASDGSVQGLRLQQ
jgi:anti-sigma factor RsiW